MRKTLLALSLGLVVLVGCGRLPGGKIHNATRVFMHEPNRYSVMYREGDGSIRTRSFVSGRIDLVADVNPGEPMWVEYGESVDNKFRYYDYYDDVTIHVHSEADVNGAGWDHGKSGRGTTTVVE